MRKILLLLLICSTLLIMNCRKNETGDPGNPKLTVGFVYVGPVGDGGWNYAHNKGKIEIEDLPFIESIHIRENASNTETTLIAIEELIEEGANLIFATSFDHKEAVLAMAKKYPKVIFESCSSFVERENLGSYFGKIYQAWYLAGVTAGLKTESNKIGFIVAHANAECIRISNAFALGVKKTNPDAIVYLEWTHAWFDPAKENKITNKMIDMGCDIIAHNTDSSESQRVAESRKVYTIGYNSDMKDFAPKKNLLSVVWHWGKLYEEVVNDVYSNKWEPKIIWRSIDSGLFGLTEYSQHISLKEREIINSFKKQIINNELLIFTGKIYDNKGNLQVKDSQTLTDEELLSLTWLLDSIEVLNPVATNK